MALFCLALFPASSYGLRSLCFCSNPFSGANSHIGVNFFIIGVHFSFINIRCLLPHWGKSFHYLGTFFHLYVAYSHIGVNFFIYKYPAYSHIEVFFAFVIIKTWKMEKSLKMEKGGHFFQTTEKQFILFLNLAYFQNGCRFIMG